jgi:hypothetical protein
MRVSDTNWNPAAFSLTCIPSYSSLKLVEKVNVYKLIVFCPCPCSKIPFEN